MMIPRWVGRALIGTRPAITGSGTQRETLAGERPRRGFIDEFSNPMTLIGKHRKGSAALRFAGGADLPDAGNPSAAI
jgi:hypothetical protein